MVNVRVGARGPRDPALEAMHGEMVMWRIALVN